MVRTKLSQNNSNPGRKSLKSKPTDSATIVNRYEKFLENSCRMISTIYPDMDSNTIHERVFSRFDKSDCCSAIYSVKKVLGEPLDDFLAKGIISEVLPLHSLKKRKDAVGCLATWAGLKKGMPDPCKCSKDASEDSFVKLTSSAFVPDAKYLIFVYRTVASLFGDSKTKITKRRYEAKVASNSPSFNGCTEGTRKHHGAFGVLDKETMDSYSRGHLPVNNFECKLDHVISSGKLRTLIKTPASWNALRPLHEVIYDFISKEKWLLRGEPSLSSVSRISEGMKKKELFLSADYESATDNLSIEVAEIILRAIRDNSPNFCPEPVWQAAFKSLRPFIHTGRHGRYQPRRGQMMGSLLSFPLLCLQNYCATRYILGDRPILINGDDLLTRVTPAEYTMWLGEVSKLGLKPSLGKCGLSRSFFTINSDYFRTSRYGIRRLPFGRLKTLMKFNEGIPDYQAYKRARAGLTNNYRVGFDRCWIRQFAGNLYKTRRSMGDLGYTLIKCAVPNHLQVREVSYDGVPKRPLPPSPSPRTSMKLHDWVFEDITRIPRGIRMIQGPVWADLKERSRHEYRRMDDVWHDWWVDVRLTGVNTHRFVSKMPTLLPGYNQFIKTKIKNKAGAVMRRLLGIEKKLNRRPFHAMGIIPKCLLSKVQEFRGTSVT